MVYDSFGCKVSLSDEVTHWDKSFLLLCPSPSSMPAVLSGFCQLSPGFHRCFSLRGFFSPLSSSSLVSYLSLWGVSFVPSFLCFSLRSTVLGFFVVLVLPALFLSSGFLRGIFCGFLHSLGFLTHRVASGFMVDLGCGPFHCALLLPCASSS